MPEKILSLLFSILGLVLFVILTMIFYENQRVNLMEYSKYENIVIDKGTALRYYNKKKNEKVFYVKLNGLDKKVGVYRMFKNYDDLLKNVNIGDKIKVFYKSNSEINENINIAVIQIEKNNEIILNKSEYQTKYRILMFFSILACLYIILAIISVIKYGKFENIIPPIF